MRFKRYEMVVWNFLVTLGFVYGLCVRVFVYICGGLKLIFF